MSLNPNRERMKAAGFDQECLDNIELAMAVTLRPEREAAARRAEELRQREKLKQERAELLEMADKALEGKYGQEGVELAVELLDGARGGRSDFNLGCLRTALRRLR